MVRGSNQVQYIMFMNTDGSVDSTVEINDSTANGPTLANGDVFGRSVANITSEMVNDLGQVPFDDEVLTVVQCTLCL